ncbi:MAG TPA: xanthine dehydrogenase family protein molybdopterin-binding subunit [Gaiellaceae bacterium]|nr:xanthine dehydrogenase family protein molybdopterin-binding subunit [Gaiellaceae bacterium]
MSILGNRVLRSEDDRFLRGRGTYVENLELEGAASVTFVRSLMAHARINGIDTSAAEAIPGVRVLTADDVPLPAFGPPPFGLPPAMGRPLVAKDVVRLVGEIVAVVVSDDRASGTDAAELVMVDYDPLPVVVDPEESLRDELLLFPEAGTNVAGRTAPAAHAEDLFDGCEVTVSGTIVSQRMAPCPLEPRSTAAAFEDGRLTLWLSTQTPHQDRDTIAGMLGLEPAQVRVIAPDVGGGFGAKVIFASGLTEEILVGWLARELGRPIRWTETRSESMLSLPHGRAMRLAYTIGGAKDGTILAYKLDVLADCGAYPTLGAILTGFTQLMSSGVYAIPRVEAEGTTVVTNTTQIGAFRGAGRPEAIQAIEAAIDRFADEVGMDPAEVRKLNYVGEFPHKTATGAQYDSGDYAGALELALRSAAYEDLRAEQKRRRDEGGTKQLGIGLSSYVEITNPLGEGELGEVEITPDGGAIVRTGSFSHGQGHETSFAMIVADRLGLPFEKVTVHKGDTDEVASGTGTYGSKSTQIGGTASGEAATTVVEQAKQLVADYLEANPQDVVLDLGLGRFHVAGTPDPSLSWEELASRAEGDGRLAELKASHEFKGAPTFPFGTHVAVVEVDTETGQVELQRMVCVDDAGTIVNPLLAEGQVHGGVGIGVSQALYEQFTFGEDGTPLTGNLTTYAFPSAAELPSWETIEMETPTPANPLGAKGIGESGTIGATPAVYNAVVDALSPFGVKHVDMPANGENVWRAIEEAKA